MLHYVLHTVNYQLYIRYIRSFIVGFRNSTPLTAP
jgi:hypothetical protein